LNRDNIKPGWVPEKFLASGTVLAKDVDSILGNKTTRSLKKDEQLSWNDLSFQSPRLSPDIQKFSRAFTLEVDASSTQGGQLRPGDHVDVLAIFDDGEHASCRTILQNIKVMAVGGQRQIEAFLTGSKNITVELSPEQCQHIALAQEIGRIFLTLRSPQDREKIETPLTNEKDLGRVTFQVK
jgi:pilus assembly protein CpaB